MARERSVNVRLESFLDLDALKREVRFTAVNGHSQLDKLCPQGAKCGHSSMLTHIAEFFAIEKDIRGRSAEERRFIRQQGRSPTHSRSG